MSFTFAPTPADIARGDLVIGMDRVRYCVTDHHRFYKWHGEWWCAPLDRNVLPLMFESVVTVPETLRALDDWANKRGIQ